MWGYDFHVIMAWILLGSAILNGVLLWLYYELKEDYEENRSLLHEASVAIGQQKQSLKDWRAICRQYVQFMVKQDLINDYRKWIAENYGLNPEPGVTLIEPTPPWLDPREPDPKLVEAIDDAKMASIKKEANEIVERVFRADKAGVITT